MLPQHVTGIAVPLTLGEGMSGIQKLSNKTSFRDGREPPPSAVAAACDSRSSGHGRASCSFNGGLQALLPTLSLLLLPPALGPLAALPVLARGAVVRAPGAPFLLPRGCRLPSFPARSCAGRCPGHLRPPRHRLLWPRFAGALQTGEVSALYFVLPKTVNCWGKFLSQRKRRRNKLSGDNPHRLAHPARCHLRATGSVEPAERSGVGSALLRAIPR